ncbi:MAG: PKD domain-containing protein, partial [Saprospiraceae bacterium]|nr:PKD domain-containing protein [Saprospiraceae bacterium]
PTGWSWTFPGGTPATSTEQNPVVTFNQDGTVTATLVVFNGVCTDTTTLNVEIDIIDDEISNPAGVCAGGSVALNPDGNAAYTYQWASIPADPSLDPNSPNPTVSPMVTTTYYVTITNGACVVVDSAVLDVIPTPEAAMAITVEKCAVEALVQFGDQSAGNPTSWQWNFPGGVPSTSNDQNPAVTYNQNGTFTATLIASNGDCADTTTQEVTINIVNDLVDNPPAICAGGAVELNPDGNLDYTYQWSADPADPNLDPDNPNPTVSPSETTNYYVTITNGVCVVLDTAQATVTPVPDAAMIYAFEKCVGEATVQFTDQSTGNPTGWLWTLPGGTPATSTEQNPLVTFSQDGTVTATLIAFNGICADTTTQEVVINIVNDQVDDPAAICEGNSIDLNPDGNPAYGYQWGADPVDPNLDPTSPNPNVSPSGSTNYYVTITNGVCVVLDTANVTVLAAPQAIAAAGQQNCLGNAVVQFTDQSLGNPVSWQWSFTPGNQTSIEENPVLTFNEDGSVTGTLIVTNAAGCTDTATISINYYLIDDIEVNSGNFCPGDSVQINLVYNADYNYQWSSDPLDPGLIGNSPNPLVAPSQATSYFVTITNGTCIYQDTAVVTPYPGGALEASDDRIVCDSTPIIIEVLNSNGAQFQWSESPDFNPVLATGDSLTVIPGDGKYYYVRTLDAFCPGLDSVWVANAAVEVEADQHQIDICLGSTADLMINNLNPNDNLTYHWIPDLPSVGNPTVEPQDTTIYTAIVTNQFGCVDTLSFQVNVLLIAAEAQITGKAVICPGDSTILVVTPAGGTSYSYEWEPASSLSNPFDSLTYAFPTETTTYFVTVTALNTECTATAEVSVELMTGECVEPYIFVPKAFTPNYDGNNDLFLVRGVNITEIYFVVFNRWGEKMYETSDPKHTGWDGTYNGKELTPDSYGWYLRATCGNGAVYENQGNVTLLK